MFLHPLTIKAIEQKIKAEKLLKECHREVVLLRDKILEFKKVADEKICEETRKHPLYRALAGVWDQLHDAAKAVQQTYVNWYYVCNESVEGWDFDYYDDETEKLVRPLQDIIDAAQIKCADLKEIVVAPIRKKYYADIDALAKKLVELEEHEKQLKALSQETYETMCLALKPILDVYNPIMENIFKMMGDSEPKKTPTIVPNLVEGSWRISWEYDNEPFECTKNIEEDDFDDTGESVRDDLIGLIEYFEEKFTPLCEELIPGLVDVSVEYDDTDVEIDGQTYHHKGYYEDDTGYGEPSGDFYYGDVTASTGVNIIVTIE